MGFRFVRIGFPLFGTTGFVFGYQRGSRVVGETFNDLEFVFESASAQWGSSDLFHGYFPFLLQFMEDDIAFHEGGKQVLI